MTLTLGNAGNPRNDNTEYINGNGKPIGGGGGSPHDPLHVLGKVFDTLLVKPGQIGYRAVSPAVLEAAQGADQLLAKTKLPGSGNAKKNIAARQAAGIKGANLGEVFKPGKDSSGKTVTLFDDPALKDNPRFVSGALELAMRAATDPLSYIGGAGLVKEGSHEAARLTARELAIQLGENGVKASDEAVNATARLIKAGKANAIADPAIRAALEKAGYTGKLALTLGSPLSTTGLAIPGTGKIAEGLDRALSPIRGALNNAAAKDGSFIGKWASPRNRHLIGGALESVSKDSPEPMRIALANDLLRSDAQGKAVTLADEFTRNHIRQFAVDKVGDPNATEAQLSNYIYGIRQDLKRLPDRGAEQLKAAIKDGARDTPAQQLVGRMHEGLKALGSEDGMAVDWLDHFINGSIDANTGKRVGGMIAGLDSYGKRVADRSIKRGSQDALEVVLSDVRNGVKLQATGKAVRKLLDENPALSTVLDQANITRGIDAGKQALQDRMDWLKRANGAEAFDAGGLPTSVNVATGIGTSSKWTPERALAKQLGAKGGEDALASKLGKEAIKAATDAGLPTEKEAQQVAFAHMRDWATKVAKGEDPFNGVDGDAIFAAYYDALAKHGMVHLQNIGAMPEEDFKFISHLVNGTQTKPEEIGKRYQEVTRMWRAMAIARPGFSNRNFWGILTDNAAYGVGLKEYRAAARAFTEYKAAHTEIDGLLAAGRTAADSGRMAAFEAKYGPEMKTAIDSMGETVGQGLAHADFYEGSKTVKFADKMQQFWEGVGDNKLRNPLSLRGFVSGVYRDVPVEINGRLALFMKLSEDGYQPEAAMSVVNKIHRDYLNLSSKDIAAKSVYPFWTFRTRNMGSQAELFARNRGVGRFMLSQMQQQLDKNQGDAFPPFLQGLQIPVGGGSVVALNALPFSDFVAKAQSMQGAAKGDLDPLRDLFIDDAGPVYKSAISLAMNKDPFTGRPVQPNGKVMDAVRATGLAFIPFLDMPRQVRRAASSNNPMVVALEEGGFTPGKKRNYGQ